jgi:hypothetical protein
MPVSMQQTTKGILHGPGDGGENMGLHGGELNHVFAQEKFGYENTLGIDLVQDQHLSLRLVVNPFRIGIVEVDHRKVVFPLNGPVTVVSLPHSIVHHHCFVMRGELIFKQVWRWGDKNLSTWASFKSRP